MTRWESFLGWVLLLCGCPANGQESKSLASCSATLLPGVEVPYHYNDPTSKKFIYRYRWIPAADPRATTILVLPGGPGQSIMNDDPARPFALGAIPHQRFHLIYTDPRGSGYNQRGLAGEDLPPSAFQTPFLARDVLEIIKKRGLTNYILYGASYGTVQATVVAKLAEELGIPPPKAVVLEGIVGKSFESFDVYFSEYQKEWERIKPQLPNVWRTALTANVLPHYSSEQWGAFISSKIILGAIPGYGPLLKYYLERISLQDPRILAEVDAFMKSVPGATPLKNFELLACEELWGGWKPERRLEKGKLVAAGRDLCQGKGLSRPYDSKNWLLSVPIFYFQGPYDPTTTPQQAQYHFEHQTASARRYFTTVAEASHAPMTMGFKSLSGPSCAEEVWKAIDQFPRAADLALQQALAKCPSRTTLKIR
jgi:pimeloyl-ACP methyl ester carboxylesterase